MNKKPYVINVLGVAGNLGKTTIAKELAIGLTNLNKKVLLIDFDLCLGYISKYLLLPLTPNMSTWCKDIRRGIHFVDVERKYFVKHSSGLYVLNSKDDIVLDITEDEIVTILNTINHCDFDFVIIDNGNNNDYQIPINMVDKQIVITTGDFEVASNTFDLLNKILLKNYPPENIHLVINRVKNKVINPLLQELNTVILECNEIKKSNVNGVSIMANPENNCTIELNKLINKIVESL